MSQRFRVVRVGASPVPNDISVIPNSRSFKDRATLETVLTRDDIEAIAGALPATTIERSADGRPAFRVRGKLYGCQRDRRADAIDAETGERLDDVMMFRVADEGVKQALLADPSGAWFTTPHFNGWPAILVRLCDLDKLSREELEEVIVDAWLCQVPKRVAKAWLADRDEPG